LAQIITWQHSLQPAGQCEGVDKETVAERDWDEM